MSVDTLASRSIPPELAPLVEQLELERPSLVTLGQLKEMLGQMGSSTVPSKAAHRLTRRGWLLPTGIAGVYEFASAERAGAISQGDALLPLRAAIARRPDIQIAAALNTALFFLNIADRAPDIPEVAVGKNPGSLHVPPALRSAYRVLRFNWRLPVHNYNGSPIHRAATILVHAAERPTQVRSWGVFLELLPAIIAASPVEDIAAEVNGRSHATKIRLAYLTHGIDPKLADTLKITPAGKIWFGPRRKLRRHNARWNVADTILPVAPSENMSPDSAQKSYTNPK